MGDGAHFTFKAALEVISQSVDLPAPTRAWQSNQLHRWVGERHMAESGRNPGSGSQIEYNEKDIRRAVAYLRLRAVGGETIGSKARVVSDRVREIAAWHPNGYVFTTDGVVLDEVFWSNTPVVTMDHLLREGRAFIALPCTVDYFG